MEFFIGSLGLLVIWLVLFIWKKKLRHEMFWVSFFTMPFGLTEPLFVPEYWSPNTLFNLAKITGFDIESLIFSFAIGGIASVLYESFFSIKHTKIKESGFFHWFSLLFAPLLFVPLYFLWPFNVIYAVFICLFLGGVLAMICRCDFIKPMLLGSVLFGVLYFVFFTFLNIIFPEFIPVQWNLQAISGILILGVPLEEIIFALGIGMLWGTYYEHFKRLKIG